MDEPVDEFGEYTPEELTHLSREELGHVVDEQAAGLWYALWSRIACLANLLGEWESTDPNHSTLGPFIVLKKHKKEVCHRVSYVYHGVEKVAWVFWKLDGPEGIAPYATDSDGQPIPLSTFGELPPLDPMTDVFDPNTATLLWVSAVARNEIIHMLWMEHVDLWKMQGKNIMGYGTTMHEQALLNRRGFDMETGELVLEFEFPLGQSMPTVRYFDED